MQAWPAVELPALPGTGPALHLYDAASGAVRAAAPTGTARMYVCGITPYDATHLGHAATYVTFDLVGRVWRDAGLAVTYVQNVTDVDEPLLERAARDGEDWRALAERETALFCEDMAALRVLPPDRFVGAVEAIPRIVEAIQGLQAKGAAYDVDGDTYFAVHTDPRFGEIGRLGEAEMLGLFAERGGDPERVGKKHPLDCLLWRAARPGEPAWDTAIGPGRPGWHIECTAIALQHLGNSFDVQGGGSDLAFPHHEMGASEGHALTGEWPFARHYVHAGMVGLDGEKMSKSKGNLVFVSTLRRDGRDPMALRLALLGHHYRTDWEWTEHNLTAGEERLDRWRRAARLPSAPPALDLLADVRRHLGDDLDAASALAAVDAWVDLALGSTGLDESGPALMAATVDALLGVHV